MYIYICIYTHIYICIYIYVYIHIYIFLEKKRSRNVENDCFLFTDYLTTNPKLRINILLTDRPKRICPTAQTTKNYVAFALFISFVL